MKGQQAVNTVVDKKPYIATPGEKVESEYMLYPVTIVKDRYNGKYSEGVWLAFNLEANEVPSEIFADDITCLKYWETSNRGTVGKGFSPEYALMDLYNRVKSIS